MNAVSMDLCVLFADISGNTRLHKKIGDTEALHAVERCLNRVERMCTAHGGRMVKTEGDKIRTVFDSAADAMRAALEMQLRVDDLPPVSGIKLAVRVGFHFGPTLVDRDEVSGETVETAARLASVARPGQIVTTADTALGLPPDMQASTREIGALTVKDKGGAMRVFEVVRAKNVAAGASAVVSTAPVPRVRLRLRYGEESIVLGPARRSATLGRDATCDVIIRDPRASRTHGTIEWRADGFVFADRSSNGTYITFEGEAEFPLKHAETVLHGSGRLVFGHAYASGETEIVEFEVQG